MSELIFGLLTGDGYISKEGRFVVEHSVKQYDYLCWKKFLLENEFKKELKIYYRKSKNTKSIYLDRKKLFLPIRNIVYKNKKKDLSKVLNHIKNIDLFLALWFFDDAAINHNGLKLCVCDSKKIELDKIINWFKTKLNISCYIRTEKHGNKTYPFLIFQKFESMIIWSYIKKYAISLPSMMHKFRFLSTEYNLNYSHLEYNKPTSPRILKIPNKAVIKVSDKKVISIYNKLNDFRKTAKTLNTTEKLVRDILVKNKALHSRGFKKIR